MSGDPDGYFTEREFPLHYYPAVAPAHLRCLSVLRNRRPLCLEQPFRFLDLGCGSGFTTSLLAAVYPESEFVGIDLIPDHVLKAVDRAKSIGLPNANYIEASFQDVVETSSGELGTFDFIVCHGVLSWVDTVTRENIYEILQRHLRTGGLVYMSYNSMPGWAAFEPARHLVQQLAESPGSFATEPPTKAALDYLGLLRQEQAGFFRDNSAAALWLDRLADKPQSYLEHEFRPRHAAALWHDRLAKTELPYCLDYLGSARLIENFDSLCFSNELQVYLDKASNAGLGETFRDFALNQSFRMDVFSRGAPIVNAETGVENFRNLGIAKLKDLSVPLTIRTPRGNIPVAGELGNIVAEAVSDGPTTVGEVIEQAKNHGADPEESQKALVAMIAGGLVEPLLTNRPKQISLDACEAFNEFGRRQVYLEQERWPAFASAFLGAGVRMSEDELVAYCNGEALGERAHMLHGVGL
ncbi:class I SAM-dependent methyltransferase [Roseovarius salinarum]|uniref:class I SAM-dependent methyltransferase n=1 Tax=Roseovarius salinarum TaxID=1981892 RepID=UPI000C3215E6|nr:class I SAM-dependent methyltransferase [Roseovarius salinarum]